ncbi:MAG: hypothetical protein H3C31_13055 [Brumimicrobium sp.]|nr:hypothetical protein [Brumimicrobium sp.]
MKIKILFLILFLCTYEAYAQKTESKNVSFSNIGGFSGYTTFNLVYSQGSSTGVLTGNSVKLYITSWSELSSEEVNLLSSKGISFSGGYEVKSFDRVGIEGRAYVIEPGNPPITHYATSSSKLALGKSLGEFTSPNFPEAAQLANKKWLKTHQKNLWVTNGGVENLKVVELLISDFKSEINTILHQAKKEKENKENLEQKDTEQKAKQQSESNSTTQQNIISNLGKENFYNKSQSSVNSSYNSNTSSSGNSRNNEYQQTNQKMNTLNEQMANLKAQQERVDRGIRKMDSGIDAMSSSFSSGTFGSDGLLVGSKEFVEGVAESTQSMGATIGAGAFVLGSSIFSSVQQSRAQKERREREEAQRRLIREQQEAEQKERERLEKEAFNLLIQQRHLLINTFSKNKEIPLSTSHVDSETIYYFIYAYNPSTIDQAQTEIYISNLFALHQFNDGTWPYQSSIENEIKDLTPYKEILQGYYLDKSTAEEMRRAFVNGFYDNKGVSINNITYRKESLTEPKFSNSVISNPTTPNDLGIPINSTPNKSNNNSSSQKEKKEGTLGIPIKM